MSSIFRARSSYLRSYLHSDVAVKANHIHDVSPVPAARVRKIIQRVAVVLSAASLAACAQSSVVSQKSGSPAASRQASQQHEATPTKKRVASAKAFALRAAQSRGRNTGGLAGSCQLLYRGNTDRERRKIRHARFDRRSSDAAIRHKVARDERRQRKVGDRSGQ